MKIKVLFIIVVVVILGSIACVQAPESETYLIPNGFTGSVTVIFNQKNGVPPKYESRRRIYEIPANGILLTQFKDEYGSIEHKYYYVDTKGERFPLHIYQSEYNKDGTISWNIKNENEIGVFLDGTTGQYARDNVAPFQLFIVTSKKRLDSIESNTDFNKRINVLIGTNL